MRVAILTITDGQNYGNRLQNYALQTVLRSFNCQVETIRRKTSRDLPLRKIIKHSIKESLKELLHRGNTEMGKRARKKAFVNFNRNFITFSESCLCDNIAPQGLNNIYDYFVCGSDQIWNARIKIVEEDIRNHLAFFARPEQKIAYAASFGTEDIAPGYEELFREQLPTFKAVGVRENTGVEIVKNCCGRQDAKVVLDPTMLLTSEEWDKIAKKPQFIENERIVVTYFLGGRSKQIKDYIDQVCAQYQAKAINLDIEFLTDDKIENKVAFSSSPDEFVWLISHAECVLTDSFHACVFAILYNKPFCVFQRKAVESGNNMSSRIETLLGRFNLTRFLGDIDEPAIMPEKYDWNSVIKVLSVEREKSLSFLRESLEISED